MTGDFTSDNNKFWFWNTAPADPLALARAGGYAHRSRATKGNLFLSSLMPVGEHAGKAMDRVPREYFVWVEAQSWAARWRDWEPVHDCLTRFPELMEATLPQPPVIFVDSLRSCVRNENWRWSESAHLTCAPGHEDKLHTFALGALRLRPQWRQVSRCGVVHYDLNAAKHALAVQCGAVMKIRNSIIEEA